MTDLSTTRARVPVHDLVAATGAHSRALLDIAGTWHGQLARGVTGHREGTQLEHTLHKVKAGMLLGTLGTPKLTKRAKRPAGEAQNMMYVAGVLRSETRSLTEASVRPKTLAQGAPAPRAAAREASAWLRALARVP